MKSELRKQLAEVRDDRTVAAARYPLEQLLQAAKQGRRVAITQAKGGYLSYVLADLLRHRQGPLVVVVPTAQAARQVQASLELFLPQTGWEVSQFPVPESSPYAEMSPDRASLCSRMRLGWELGELRGGQVLVVPLLGWVRKTTPAAMVRAASVTFAIRERLDGPAVAEQLRAAGYQSTSVVEDPGTFSLRGGLLDVFSPAYEKPFRVDLFGDQIESIRWFDPESQRSAGIVERAIAIPTREELLTEEGLEISRRRLRALADRLGTPSNKVSALLRELERKERYFGIETIQPAFAEALEPLASRIPKEATVVLVDPTDLFLEHARMMEAREREWSREREQGSIVFEPSEYFLSSEELIESFSAGGFQIEVGARDASLTTAEELAFPCLDVHEVERVRKARGNDEGAIAAALTVVDSWRDRVGRVVVVCSSRSTATRVAEVLRSQKREVQTLASSDALFEVQFPPATHLEVLVGDALEGFVAPSRALAVITERELLGKAMRRSGREQMHEATAVASFKELEVGDLVVHVDFGVAKYAGLTRLAVGDIENDFLTLEFAEGDRIHIPVYRLSKVQRYTGSSTFTRLDRLSGSTWEKTKGRIKAALADVAEELIRLYAERATREGFAFSAPDSMYHEFEASFPYEETPHQARAIDDVLSDMQSNKPMDRLLCGDVGFGKTEVAIRAAYKAVCDGKQVAILVPTTVLCEQHLNTFRRRLSETGARIEALSRFRTPQEVKAILAATAEGKVDIVIGTHRLISKDVEIPNLALLIIDEEQRFGVQHKERLKQLRSSVDVLTMTATPIPRTLEMSLLGIRDLSIITTPPPGRLSVRTHLARFRDSVVREGIEQELARGGQVYFVHNRVDTIYGLADEIRRMVPEARVGVGHAQMKDDELEKVMMDFIAHRIDVLISTTIVESGIDISTANTMFINHADKFGLAQLYQLRGRVGRGSDRAYCYLLVADPGRLPPDSKRRLEVLMEHSELGSGMAVAQHDLDMRGAGNILGDDQNGHIEAIGFELYSELLAEAVGELSGEPAQKAVEPEVKIPVAAFVPEDYVEDIGQRLSFYKRLSLAPDSATVYDVMDEMQDRYGPVPINVEHLRDLVLVKLIMKQIVAKQIEVGPKAIVVELLPETTLSPDKVMALIASTRGQYEVRPGLILVRKLQGRESVNLMETALLISREVARCARDAS